MEPSGVSEPRVVPVPVLNEPKLWYCTGHRLKNWRILCLCLSETELVTVEHEEQGCGQWGPGMVPEQNRHLLLLLADLKINGKKLLALCFEKENTYRRRTRLYSRFPLSCFDTVCEGRVTRCLPAWPDDWDRRPLFWNSRRKSISEARHLSSPTRPYERQINSQPATI